MDTLIRPLNGSSAAHTPTAPLTHHQEQTSNAAPALVDSGALKRPRYKEAHNIAHEPQTVVLHERLAAAGATLPAQELVSLPSEKLPVLEGLEACTDAEDAFYHFTARWTAKTAPLQEREVFSAIPAFSAAATRAPEATSSSIGDGAYKTLAASLASAPAVYPHLELAFYSSNHNKNQQKTIPANDEKTEEVRIPSALEFATTSQLYHSMSSDSIYRISAAAHFIKLLLQETPGNVASLGDIYSWGALYGLKKEDLRAAVRLGDKDGIILSPTSGSLD